MTYACTSEHHEELGKAVFHMGLGAMASAAFFYNLLACRCRPSKSLATNALIYGGLMCLEGLQVARHLSHD